MGENHLLTFLKQRDIVLLLVADYAVCAGCNVFTAAALMLMASMMDRPMQMTEVIFLSQLAILAVLPLAGFLAKLLGAWRALAASLAMYAALPLTFFGLITCGWPPKYLAILSGLVVGLNLPASAACTYVVVPRALLQKFYMFVMATSTACSFAYPVSAYLYAWRPLASFAAASVLLGLAAFLCGRAVYTEHEANQASDQVAPVKRGKRELLLFIGVKIMYSVGFYMFFCVVLIRVIMPRVRGAGAASVGHVLAIIIVVAILVTILVNHVFKITIKSSRMLSGLMAVASTSIVILYQHTMILVLVYGVVVPVLLTGGNAVFASLGYALDVRCPASQGKFLMVSMLGATLAFGVINYSLRFTRDLRWVILGFAGLSLAAAELTARLLPPIGGKGPRVAAEPVGQVMDAGSLGQQEAEDT